MVASSLFHGRNDFIWRPCRALFRRFLYKLYLTFMDIVFSPRFIHHIPLDKTKIKSNSFP